MALDGLAKESLRDQIAGTLRSEIIGGKHAPGSPLVERQLADNFGVSTAPVREALMQLVEQGFLNSATHRGVTVASPPPSDVLRLFGKMRAELEQHALSSLFDEPDQGDADPWRQILSRMRRACEQRDAASVALQDFAFHRLLVEKSGRRDLLITWTTIYAKARINATAHVAKKSGIMSIYDQHADIIEPLRNGKKKAALAALATNLSTEVDGKGL